MLGRQPTDEKKRKTVRTLRVLATTLVTALALVTCVDYAASAATGKPFILGKLNKAGKQTTLKRTTAGPALQLRTTSAASAPLVTNATGKVVNLNADLVDGLDASLLRTRSYVWRATFTDETTVEFVLPLPAGSYVVSYSNHFTGLGAPAGLRCYIREGSRWTGVEAFRHDTSGSYYPALSGTGLVTKTAANTVRVGCDGSMAFDALPDQPLEIIATPTAIAGSGSISPLRTGGR